jgi:hypothetical protein
MDTVFGAVKSGFVIVEVVKLPGAGGVDDPEGNGTAITTVPVPPAVTGGLVRVLVVEIPASVTVTVV